MALRLTSENAYEPREPRPENLMPLEKRDANLNSRTPESKQENNVQALDSQKLVAADVALDWVLQEIVQQARLATSATGAFVGVLRAHKIVCPAISGSTAGEFVAYLNRDRRIVDSCLGTADAQSCRDSETFDQLDGSACRYVGARSVVIIPILDEKEEALGIFGVFSPQADAFSSANLVALQGLSRRIADAMVKVGQCTSLASGNASSPQPDREKSLPNANAQFRPRLRPLVNGATVWIVGILAALLLLGWTFSRALSHRAMLAPEPPAPVAQAPSSDSEPASNSAPIAAPQSSSMSAQPSSQHPLPDHAPTDSARNAAVDIKPQPHKPAVPKVAKKTPTRSPSDMPDLEIENALDDASSESLPPQPAKEGNRPHPPRTRLTPQSTNAVTKMTLMNAGTAAMPNNRPSSAPPREAVRIMRDPDPPGASAASPAIAANPNPQDAGATPAGPVMIPENTALERLADRVEPEYPQEALDQHVQGSVTVDVVVAKDGQIERATPIDGDSRLQAAAAKAVRKWQFAPLLRNGHFVRFESHITVRFALP